jgi:hypothetical protein
LGVVQRQMGKTQASTEAFRKAMRSPGRDAEITRLVALALNGVVPDQQRVSEQWPKAQLVARAEGGEAQPFVKWPGVHPQGVRKALPARDPVTFDLDDVPVADFLHTLITNGNGQQSPRELLGWAKWPASYRPPKCVQALDVVIHAGVRGRLTVRSKEMPWNDLFENVLASNGLGFVLDKSLLYIAGEEHLRGIDRVRGRTYGGRPITLNFLNGNLLEMLGPFRDVTGFELVPDGTLAGTMTVRFSERPALEVLDLLLVANDLTATRDAAEASTLRLRKVSDVRGNRVDLSTLTPAPNRP